MPAKTLLASVAAVVMTVGACGSSEPSAPYSVETAGEFTAVVSHNDLDGMDALFSGSVTRLSSGCFGIADSESEQVHLTVWPSGTKMSDDGDYLLLPGGVPVHEGVAIKGGGGLVPADSGELPEECGAKEVLVLHSVDIEK
ncbi:hypothetical protein [Jonesia quinghaiensis]|uniref:hypothetical protein n=1 Tax=Jonesia quinghaiensis TaxID=262806 RepID=UPI0003FB846E|nr:hypothetical protein [Jonesia quinghaiensis]